MTAAQYKDRIRELLAQRSEGKTICPSEVLPTEERKDKVKMEAVREAARSLVVAGEIEITQKGRVVDPNSIKGPIRLRLKN
jgi:hypothetical protein